MLRRSTSRSSRTGHLRKITQKLSSLIQQRNISLRERGIRRASQQLTLSLRQLTSRRLQIVRLREQRAQQSLRRQRHPRQVQGTAHIHRGAHIILQIRTLHHTTRRTVQLIIQLRGQLLQQNLHERLTSLIMRLARRTSTRTSRTNHLRSQLNISTLNIQTLNLSRHLLTIRHRTLNNLHHAQIALQRGNRAVLLRHSTQTRIQGRQRSHHHASLTQRRKHTLDIPHERIRRTNHQHTSLRQALTVRIQQVRRTMQRHSSLTGTRATLHNTHTRQLRADNRILLSLNRRHNIAHAAGTLLIQRRQQRTLTVESVLILQHLRVEDLILNIYDSAALKHQMTAAAHTHRLESSRLIERTRLRGTPIHQQTLLIAIRNTNTTDITHRISALTVHIQATKRQTRIHSIQLRQTVLIVSSKRVTLRTVLMTAHRLILTHSSQLLSRLLAELIQASIHASNILTLRSHLLSKQLLSRRRISRLLGYRFR